MRIVVPAVPRKGSFLTSFGRLALLALLLGPALRAQPSAPPALTLETLFASRTFSADYFQGGRWATDGPVVTFVEADPDDGSTDLVRYDLERDRREVVLDGARLRKPDGEGFVQIEDYAWSATGDKMLLYTDSERVWRLNTKGYYYVYDAATEALTPLSDRAAGFQMFAKFSPQGDRVAFVRNRDLWVVDLATMQETRLTDTGSDGGVINGTFDWVYEEEFGLRDGFRWSPDGRYLAFFQLDETATRDFQMTDFRTLYPEYTRFRYPKAGEANSEIRIGVVDLGQRGREGGPPIRFFDTGTWRDAPEGGLGPDGTSEDPSQIEYLALMGWTPADADGRSRVWTARLDRDQNDLDLLYLDPADLSVEVVLQEREDSFVEVETGFSDLDIGKIQYLPSGRFVWRSDRTGYSHVYLYAPDGEPLGALTEGEYDVTAFHAIDEDAGTIWVTTTAESPLERHLYTATVPGLAAGQPEPVGPDELVRVTAEPGWHSAELSADRRYFLDTFSDFATPPVTRLHRADGELVKVLQANARLRATLAAYDLPTAEFTTVPAADGTPLHAYLVRPKDFDPSRAYPLLIHTYGGPGSQEVRNAWAGTERLWHAWLAERYGIIVAGVDNRGSGGRGKTFKAQTYRRLGILEAEDQIAAAQHWGREAWVDEDRMGIWGWSYGGYLTLLAMTYGDGPETFSTGAAVAPVTNWRFYDTIYTERYLSTPQANAAGYDLGSPVTYADRLRDDQDLLLVHGDFDDNVHVQNTIVMADALQAAGKQFDMMIYPGRDHGIYGGNTRLHLYTLLTDFFAESLGGAEAVSVAPAAGAAGRP